MSDSISLNNSIQPTSLVDWFFDIFRWDVRALTSATLIFFMVFINAADFQGADAERFTFKYQIYFRLLVCGLAGLYAFAHLDIVVRKCLTYPGMLSLLFAVWVIITVPASMSFSYSGVSAIALFCAVLFVPVAIEQCGRHRFIMTLLWGSLAYVATSWFLYFVFPEIGIWKEFLAKDEFLERMGGLGHPNALGLFASTAFVLSMVLWHDKRLRTFEVLLIALIWVATIYFCLSRTSSVIAILAVGAVFYYRLWTQTGFTTTLVGAIAIVLAVLYLAFFANVENASDGALMSVSKSGDKTELTSVTGRSEIWIYAIKQIGERPLFGCGYGCARFVMDEHSYHAHNIVLNAGLMTGITGSILVAWIMLIAVKRWLLEKNDAYFRALVVLFIVGGLVESLIYDPCPSLQAVLFFSILFWPRLGDDEPNNQNDIDALDETN